MLNCLLKALDARLIPSFCNIFLCHAPCSQQGLLDFVLSLTLDPYKRQHSVKNFVGKLFQKTEPFTKICRGKMGRLG